MPFLAQNTHESIADIGEAYRTVNLALCLARPPECWARKSRYTQNKSILSKCLIYSKCLKISVEYKFNPLFTDYIILFFSFFEKKPLPLKKNGDSKS